MKLRDISKWFWVWALFIVQVALANDGLVELSISNQTAIDFTVSYKLAGTTIWPIIDELKSYTEAIVTMTSVFQDTQPSGTFLFTSKKPYQYIGITVTRDKRVVVTGCPYCDPPHITYVDDNGEARVTIKIAP
jgi:hypothetical protein